MIRTLRIEDLPAVKAVIDASELFPSEMLDEMVAPFLGTEPCQEFWLVDVDPEPIAVAYCAQERMTEGTWNQLLIAVHPEHRGRGIGTQIMNLTEQILREQGERLLLVETSGTNAFERARGFYRGKGYEEVACLRDYYAAGDDKIIFRKSLS
ncbi:GNAT family N-acetyltransferase [Botrimarina hoheduenensis]|uniref:Acetyltransferase (GNAT) family protein n=1 Tax=Botrimarina hoheduenensis TaxID=2528000 RepID=A0A5C5WEZ2_9BACT|nr:GNAT family N-acetyltransferase [Botrimarina hoheduenensis]TWT48649.1 Acetyltransferase (GNAT) family protein [Botrimarina hoheduenensis]